MEDNAMRNLWAWHEVILYLFVLFIVFYLIWICFKTIREHVSSAVKDADVLAGIADEQSKDGANIILPSADGLGSLHLGGFMASGIKYVDMHHITHVVNAAGGEIIIRFVATTSALSD